MSGNRFLFVLRCLHFTSANTRADDGLGNINSMVAFFNTKMNSHYYPGKELSLGGGAMRGHLHFKRNIHNKHQNYGIKLYMFTEPDGLVLKFGVYEGSADEYSGTTHTSKIVMHLLEEKLDQGHAVYLDNFYNSVDSYK
ncbi:piggyBac transposable element-derived protein 4-like [Diorhabda carinulata]|uniref:piggyBac transposable element-derived protein 4-like n=1 Tax=Diorhabda carinulata TaxID=1163345 RepID=UPI0025A130C8|nr:piggyBac transposable element-derived protein 4-like [Diorhabda carinulata]